MAASLYQVRALDPVSVFKILGESFSEDFTTIVSTSGGDFGQNVDK